MKFREENREREIGREGEREREKRKVQKESVFSAV
jgi:hypothetical protein